MGTHTIFEGIRTEQDSLSNENEQFYHKICGMAVTVEIRTGERRVIEFFISPFIKYVDESLTLR